MPLMYLHLKKKKKQENENHRQEKKKKKHWFPYRLERKPAPVRIMIGSIADLKERAADKKM